MIRYIKSFLLLSTFLLKAKTSIAQPVYGGEAYEIALPTIKGDTIKLSSLKGKVVLLDFWASWCGPCRVSNRGLAKMYSKYKDAGFEIFGVSLDDSKAAWKKAVEKDKVKWLQVNEAGGWEAKTARRWGINAIPTTYLINKEGKLIAMDLEPKELEMALKNLLNK